jgi:hypothetical protein
MVRASAFSMTSTSELRIVGPLVLGRIAVFEANDAWLESENSAGPPCVNLMH